MDLSLQSGPRVIHQFHALKLITGHHEDFDVDHQHYEQWRKDTPKEIEIYHVAHGDHILKETLHRTAAFIRDSIPRFCAVAGGTVFTIPTQEWSQSNAKGKDPEDSNDPSCSGPSDQTFVPVQENIICYLSCFSIP